MKFAQGQQDALEGAMIEVSSAGTCIRGQGTLMLVWGLWDDVCVRCWRFFDPAPNRYQELSLYGYLSNNTCVDAKNGWQHLFDSEPSKIDSRIAAMTTGHLSKSAHAGLKNIWHRSHKNTNTNAPSKKCKKTNFVLES